jgi:hypothetical protein
MRTGYNCYLSVDGLLKCPFCFNSFVPVVFENQDLVVELSETVIDVRRAQSRGLPDLLDLRYSFLDNERLHLGGLHRLVDCGELGGEEPSFTRRSERAPGEAQCANPRNRW